MAKAKFIEFKNLGGGRVECKITLNFYLICLALLLAIGLGLCGAVVYAIWLLLGALWTYKWWTLGAIGAAGLIWLLRRINWKAVSWNAIKISKPVLGWIGGIAGVIALVGLVLLCFKGCNKQDEAIVLPEAEKTVVVDETVFKDAGDWIQLDAYLSEGFNIMYADYKKFASYGEVLTYEERIEAFDDEAYYRDWGKLFPYFEGKSFSSGELAALKRYGLWCGLAGFETSRVCKKLKVGKTINDYDLRQVYTSEGKPREYSSPKNAEHAKKYAWVLMAVFNGDITIDYLLDCPVKSYESISINEMYDTNSNYIFNEGLKRALKCGQNKTTREVLAL